MRSSRYTVVGLSLLLLFGCGTVVNVADYAVSRSTIGGATRISDADLDDLRSGRIEQVRVRYSSRPPASLSLPQLGLLCDVLAKYRDFDRALACLNQYESRAGRSAALNGKRALIALALGDPSRAAELTSSPTDAGSRYVHALAQARMGQVEPVRATADQLATQFDPKLIYYAASLYSAIGDNVAALHILEDPQRRLLRDYGLTRNITMFGRGEQAPFRLDVFDEFNFGPLGNFSYAPAGNVYVEYLAAHSLLELGRLEEAARRLDVLLEFPGLPGYRDVEWLVLYDRGRVSQRQGRLEEARGLFGRSITDIESMRRSVSSDEGRIGFAARKQDVYEAQVDLLRSMGQADAALEYAERARSRSLVDLLASRNDLAPREVPAEKSSELLENLQMAEARDEFLPAPSGGRDALRSPESSQIRDRILSRAPSLAPLISVNPVSVADMRGAIAPDETAVAYFRTGSNWAAFVFSRGDLRIVSLPVENVNVAVLSFLKNIVSSAGSNPEAYRTGARALYDALIRPVEPYVRGQHLVLVPYGILHYVPFAALNDGTSYLIEKYTLRQIPSLSAAVIASKLQASGTGSLILGNPTRNGDAPPLPGAEREAIQVGRLLPAATVLLQAEATLASFRSLAPSKAYIHLASHGQFDPRTPLRSRLLLSPSSGDNGDLTVASLYTIRLDAHLVMLSACETAVSQLSDGDDLVGLVRGFLFAGAENVIATLWEVPDIATGELVEAFYAALTQTHSVPEALHRAQIATMRQHPEPVYWAAFVPVSFSPGI